MATNIVIPMWLHTAMWVAGGVWYGWLLAQVRYPKDGDR